MKEFDLEKRTYEYARRCRDLVLGLPKNQANFEYGDQLIRASGSVAANYIEANEALSKKDFIMRLRICRKEAKESKLWLNLILVKPEQDIERQSLITEAFELVKIFSSIIDKNGG